jgi:hypothetical protein
MQISQHFGNPNTPLRAQICYTLTISWWTYSLASTSQPKHHHGSDRPSVDVNLETRLMHHTTTTENFRKMYDVSILMLKQINLSVFAS